MKTYQFKLQVDDAYDLQVSTLCWKYHNCDETKTATIKSRDDIMVLFEIQAYPGSIEYWYVNYKGDAEYATRNMNLEKDPKIDRFNYLSLIVQCSINSQNFQQYNSLYYIGQGKRKLINFDGETLIYIPLWYNEAQFLIENQDDDEKQLEIKFHIPLEELSPNKNSLQLEIFRNDLENCLSKQDKRFRQQNGRINFHIDDSRKRDFDDIIIFQQNQVQKEADRQSNSLGGLIQQIRTMDSDLLSSKCYQSFKKRDNFFQETQQPQNTFKYINKKQSQILQRDCKPISKFCTTEHNFYPKDGNIKDLNNTGRQLLSKIELDKLVEKSRQSDQKDETEEKDTMVYTILQPINCDPSLYQLDNITLIKLLQEKDNEIKELNTNYQSEINNLMVKIQNLNIKLNEEKEHAQDLSRLNWFKVIQNYRSRRYSPQRISKTYSQSTANLMKINPQLSFAKDVISQNSSSIIPCSTKLGIRKQNDRRAKTIKTEASIPYQ
ncbi:unnamed protein product [Paramecium octaurelia]|uniref:Uncharacterized protein n=1 Tax=Paramecium octaurelia TaxID=43137 RepID=A0A8S1VMP4_PAROT|nr:unnamed protein product [Paramecium octaurelia]